MFLQIFVEMCKLCLGKCKFYLPNIFQNYRGRRDNPFDRVCVRLMSVLQSSLLDGCMSQ